MTCPRCNGAKSVPGHWTAQQCPECSGTGDALTLHAIEDKNMPGCLAMIIALGACAVFALAATVWGMLT